MRYVIQRKPEKAVSLNTSQKASLRKKSLAERKDHSKQNRKISIENKYFGNRRQPLVCSEKFKKMEQPKQPKTKIKVEKSVAFPHISNKQSETEILKDHLQYHPKL